MTVEQKLHLPFHDNFSVDIQIRILPTANGYEGYVNADFGPEHPFFINLTNDDVSELTSGLQNALEEVRLSVELKHSLREQESALRRLAERGAFAFNRIFATQNAQRLIKQALQNSRTIQITSNSFLLPWEVIYDRPLKRSVDISGFWGMRYNLARSLTQQQREGDFVSPVIVASRPRVGLMMSAELQYAVSDEIPHLQRLDNSGRINLSQLPVLNTSRKDHGIQTLKSFLRTEREIVHVACHAFEDRKNPSLSRLRVEDAFEVTIENFGSHQFSLMQHPLVVLNACRTGVTDPSRTTNWVSEFWRCGARGVVATELSVPDWFAASFVKQLYTHLLNKRKPLPLGESLMKSRHHFWNLQRNSLGLAYALYASPNLRFAG